MKKIVCILVLLIAIESVVDCSRSRAEMIPVSFGMSREEVINILGKPDVETDHVYMYKRVGYDIYEGLLMYCIFINEELLELIYSFDYKLNEEDIQYLETMLELNYGKELGDQELELYHRNIDILGPWHIGNKLYVGKSDNVYVSLYQNERTGFTLVLYMVDVISRQGQE